MIKTVIFDLDDTLYNEIDYCKSGFKAVANYLAEKTLKTSPEQAFNILWDKFNTSDRTKVFNNALNELSIDYEKDFIINLVNVYRNHKPDICLPDDSRHREFYPLDMQNQSPCESCGAFSDGATQSPVRLPEYSAVKRHLRKVSRSGKRKTSAPS